MRHGEAEARSTSDEERHLTMRGKTQAKEQGQWLKSMNVELDKVLVSPYVRTQDTFFQINEIYQNSLIDKQEIWKGITPDGNSSNVVNYLILLFKQKYQSVLLLSHLPLVSEIVTELCGKNPASFYPSTIVQIEFDGQNAIVEQIKYPN
ncbi:phosphohistidine phosphatase SixA [Seminibacterium arietis]|uniref:Phosphohistidine phosphatase SixA n=1 Tax=Seminibacterium arietis TaxID=1173502 RepID=A0ABW3I9T6_9PAST